MAVNNTGGSFLDKLLGGIKQIARNFVTVGQRPTLNFINFAAVVDNPSMGTIDVYGTSGSTGGGITIIENNGSAMPTEPALNFVGFVLGDDPAHSRTNVALPSPGTTAVANGGTGRTSLTSHAVLLGEGGSPIGFAVPTSSGFVLTDQGPGADPLFAAPPSGLPGGTGIVEVTSGIGGVLAIPLDVAHGGTGDTTLASHAVLLGRGTGTVAFATPTSSGFVLLDNGPGLDPSFGPPVGGFPSPSSADTVLTFDAVAFPTGAHLGWTSKRGVNNVRSYGALGDDSHDDTTAIGSAFTAAAANGLPVYFPPPPVAYKITSMLQPPKGIAILGDATDMGQCTIRAHASMSAVLAIHCTDSSPRGTVPNYVRGLTLDGNSVAKYCLLRNGDWLSEYDDIFCENAIYDGEHSVGHRLPAVFGSVSTGGGAPAGLTVSQPDPNYISVGSVTCVVKCLGASTFVVSFDGGVTFPTFTQAIIPSGPSNLMVASLGQVSSFSGIQVHFPATPGGGFLNGMTWTFTITIQSEDAGEQHAINTDSEIRNLWVLLCGQDPVDAGTVAVNVGSPLVTGTTTTWLTGPAAAMRPGDSITIVLSGVAGPGTTFGTFPVLGVVDDTHLLLDQFDGGLVQASGSGLAYHRAIGWGVYTDDSGDNVRNRRRSGRIGEVANGIRCGGDSSGGDYIEGIRLDDTIQGNVGIGILVGGILQRPIGTVSMANEIKTGWGCRYYFPFGSKSSVIEPKQALALATPSDMYGLGSAWVVIGGSGLRYAPVGSGLLPDAASSQPFNSLQLIASTVSLTGANQVLTPPDTTSPTPIATTYTILQPNADYVGANSPVLAAPRDVGQIWAIAVDTNTNFAVGFQDKSQLTTRENLSAAAQVLFGGEMILFLSVLNLTVFTPEWVQFGEVMRQWHGPRNKGSGTGKGSDYVKTSGTTPGIVAIDLTFSGAIAFVVKARVAAQDTGNTDWAIWDDARVAVDSSPATVGSFSVAETYGSNAGGVPATWGAGTPANALVPSVVNVAGDFQLQFACTGATGRTIKWMFEYETISVVRF